MNRVLLSSPWALAAVVAGLAPAQAGLQRLHGLVGTDPDPRPADGEQPFLPSGHPACPGPGEVQHGTRPAAAGRIGRLDFYGAEAEFLSQFAWDGAVIYAAADRDPRDEALLPALGPVGVGSARAQALLPFSIWIKDEDPAEPAPCGEALAPCLGTAASASTTSRGLGPQPDRSRAWQAFLRDGSPIDSDQDDLWVGIACIPAPGEVILFGAGLLGFGAARRRG